MMAFEEIFNSKSAANNSFSSCGSAHTAVLPVEIEQGGARVETFKRQEYRENAYLAVEYYE